LKNYPQTPKSALRLNNESVFTARPVVAVMKELDPVEVYCRVKPLAAMAESGCIRILNEETVALVPPENCSAAWKQGIAKESHYSFKHVFDETVSQKAIFDSVALPLVEVSVVIFNDKFLTQHLQADLILTYITDYAGFFKWEEHFVVRIRSDWFWKNVYNVRN